MNIFDKRPLFLILTALISGFVIVAFSDGIIRGVLIGLTILLSFLSLFLLLKGKISNKLFLIIPIAFLIAMLLSLGYFELYFDLYDQYEEEVEVEGTVLTIERYKYSSDIIVKTSKINGKLKPGYKIRIYIPKYQIDERIEEGSKISFKAKLGEFEDFSDIDANIYYFSDGINANAYDTYDIRFIKQGYTPLASQLKEIRNNITTRVASLSNIKSAALFSALFLGERDLLNDQIRLNFKILGITHILALSGLHLSIISMGVLKVLSALGVKKKARMCVMTIFIIAYMLFTGFPISVVRAGLMMIICTALFLLGRTQDSLTSLGISVVIILIITPYAVFDLALWLSALSTLGISIIDEFKKYKPTNSIKEKILKIAIDSLMASFFATSATLLITSYIFGTISIASAIATLFFSLLAESVIYIGMIMLLVGNIIPLGWILNFVSDISYKLSDALSSHEWIYISTNSGFIKFLITLYSISFALFLILNIRDKRKLAGILAITFVLTLGLSTISNAVYVSKDFSVYCADDNGDRLIINSDAHTSLIDINTYSASSAYDSTKLLSEYRITHLENYYLTHYSPNIVDNVSKTIALIKTDYILVPSPKDATEARLLEEIRYCIEEYNVSLYVYNQKEEITLSEYTISNIYRTNIESSERKLCLEIRYKEIGCLYLSSGMLEGDYAIKSAKLIFENNVLIFGRYGTKYKKPLDIPYNENVTRIVLNSKKLDLVGYNQEIYKNNGTEILTSGTAINIFN